MGDAVCYPTAKRPTIGTNVKMLSKEDAAALGVTDGISAIQVQQIGADADGTKLEVGDIIFKINGRRITDLTELLVQIRKVAETNNIIPVKVIREKKQVDVETPVIKADAIAAVVKKAPITVTSDSSSGGGN